jgi:hypothetical protein
MELEGSFSGATSLRQRENKGTPFSETAGGEGTLWGKGSSRGEMGIWQGLITPDLDLSTASCL